MKRALPEGSPGSSPIGRARRRRALSPRRTSDANRLNRQRNAGSDIQPCVVSAEDENSAGNSEEQDHDGISGEESGEAEESHDDDGGLTSEGSGNEELSEDDNDSDDDEMFLDEDAEEDESCCESDGFQGGNLEADFQSRDETAEECSQAHKVSRADGRMSSKPSRVRRAPRKPPISDDAPESSWDPDIDQDERPSYRTLLSYPGWKAKQGLPSHSEHHAHAHLKDRKSDGMRDKKSSIDGTSLHLDEIEEAHPVHGSKPATNRFRVSKPMRGSRPRIPKGRPSFGPLTLTRDGPFATPITTSRTTEPVRATYSNRTNRPNIDSPPGIQSRPLVSPEAARRRITRALHNFDRRGSRPRRTVYRQRQRSSSEDETGVEQTGAYTVSDESDSEESDRRSRARGSDASATIESEDDGQSGVHESPEPAELDPSATPPSAQPPCRP